MDNIFFSTDRLYVTLPSVDDYEKLCILQSNAEVMRFFGGCRDKTTVYSKMIFFMEHYKKHNVGYGLVYSKETDNFIGRCGLNKLDFDDNTQEIELGYMLFPQYWYQGFGTELCNALIQYAYEILHLKEVFAVCNKQNFASKKILEKVNMSYIGDIKYQNIMQLLYKKSL